jgi:uncharacterized protein (TIGR00266 family)
MQYLVKSGNAYGVLRIELQADEFIHARENAICAFSDHIAFTQSKSGGFFRRLARKFSGAHLAMQEIISSDESGWVMLAPPMMGAIIGIELHGKNILVEQDAFLASAQSVNTNGRLYPLAKNKFASENFHIIKFGGEGLVFLNAFGAIEAMTLLPEQTMRVHPSHLIAWEEQLVFKDTDRGFIHIIGPGRLWLQTRNPHDFHDWQDGLKEARKSANS